jgi:hypothetical protein
LDQKELAAQAISPELVLVDSALAVRARADLPWRPWEAHPPIEVVPIEWPPAAAAVPAPRHRRFTPSFGIAAAAGLAVLTLSVLPTRDRPTLAAVAESVKPPPRVTPSTPTPQPPPAQVKPARTTRAAAPKQAPATTTTPEPTPKATPKPKPKPKAAPQPAPQPKPKPKPKALPPTPPPKRTYAWKPYAGAVYYQVSFQRNGGAFYQAQTRTTRVRLPDSLKFRPGRYSWTVRPAIVADLGIRLGDEIIRRAFVVRGD